MMKIITIILFSIFLNGCGSAKEANASSNMKQLLNENLSGSFYINTLEGNQTGSITLSITFNDATKKVTGFSGCNNFTANYQIDKNKISFKNLITTEKACLDDINTIENTIHSFLKETTEFKLEDDQITFLKESKALFSAKQITKETSARNAQSTGITFEYSAFSRGTYKNVKVTEKEVSTQFSRSEKVTTKAYDKTDWENLMRITKDLKISSISKLEPPSKAHQYDGAAHATLTITDGEESYTTPTFDAGNPPEKIKELVNSVLNIATSQH